MPMRFGHTIMFQRVNFSETKPDRICLLYRDGQQKIPVFRRLLEDPTLVAGFSRGSSVGNGQGGNREALRDVAACCSGIEFDPGNRVGSRLERQATGFA
jgi:hypothetical protein